MLKVIYRKRNTTNNIRRLRRFSQIQNFLTPGRKETIHPQDTNNMLDAINGIYRISFLTHRRGDAKKYFTGSTGFILVHTENTKDTENGINI
jgi:hypothetical protein